MTTEGEPIYTHTGHPLVDVGAAVIAAYNGRGSVEEVTAADLARIAEFVSQNYFSNPLKSFLTTVFPNSAYANPTMGPDRRRAAVADVLATKPGSADGAEPCAFCRHAGRRRFRQHIPLVTGESIINFTPGGQAGLPVCAHCLVAVQACVLGALKCQGRILLAHSDDEALTLEFAARFLNRNRELLSMASGGKYPESKHPGTILLSALQDAQSAQRWSEGASLTAYHLTNYGTSANADIYHLPCELLAFVATTANPPPVRQGWNCAVQRGWRMGLRPAKGKTPEEPTEFHPGEHCNVFYEDLVGLADGQVPPERFVRKHLRWRTPKSLARAPTEVDMPDAWPLTELFLRMVLQMEKARVEVLKTIAERLAAYVVERNEKRLFERLWRDSAAYAQFRNHLMKASYAQVQRGEAPLISFEEFLLAFEEGEEIARPDWRLARDLLLIAMMDELHARGWLQEHAEDLEALPEDQSANDMEE